MSDEYLNYYHISIGYGLTTPQPLPLRSECEECWEDERGDMFGKVWHRWDHVPHRNWACLCLWQVSIIVYPRSL